MFPHTALPFLALPTPRSLSEAPEDVLKWRKFQRRSHFLPIIGTFIMGIPFGWLSLDSGVGFALMAYIMGVLICFWPGWVSTLYLNYRLDRALLKTPLIPAYVTNIYERTAPQPRGQYRTVQRILTVYELEAGDILYEFSLPKNGTYSYTNGQSCEVLAADDPLAIAIMGDQVWSIKKLGTAGRIRRWWQKRG